MKKAGVRIDKWLWAVRFYKTRSIASKACNAGKVKIDGKSVKPSKTIEVGDLIQYGKNGLKYQAKVLQLIEKRVGASEAVKCYEDLTPQSELEKLKEKPIRSVFYPRYEGKGRPTKKERRQWDKHSGKP